MTLRGPHFGSLAELRCAAESGSVLILDRDVTAAAGQLAAVVARQCSWAAASIWTTPLWVRSGWSFQCWSDQSGTRSLIATRARRSSARSAGLSGTSCWGVPGAADSAPSNDQWHARALQGLTGWCSASVASAPWHQPKATRSCARRRISTAASAASSQCKYESGGRIALPCRGEVGAGICPPIDS
jgi:hypothetical protein